jgi:arginine N-succinyltransferase
VPHPSGRAAMRMLENEGFSYENYVDIFDGGPTMTARTDNIRSVKEAIDSQIVGIEDGGETKVLASRGRLASFVCAYAQISHVDGGILIDNKGAALLGLKIGDNIAHVNRW